MNKFIKLLLLTNITFVYSASYNFPVYKRPIIDYNNTEEFINAKKNRDENGWTKLNLAVKSGDINLVEQLVNEGAIITWVNDTDDGNGPLHIASEYGHINLIEYLLKLGADINSQNDFGDSPLHIACINKQLNTAKYLISKHAAAYTINKKEQTPFHIACILGDVRLIYETALNHKIFYAKDKNGATGFHLAVYNGHLEAVKYFVLCNANMNTKTDKLETPLHIACRMGHKNIVEYLLDNKANIESTNDQRLTPLNIALMFGHEDIAKLLIEKGANINYVISKEVLKKNPEWNPNLYIRSGKYMTPNLNLKEPMYIHDWQIDMTMLHFACMGGCLNIIKSFSTDKKLWGKSINKLFYTKEAALDLACRYKHIDIVKFLLKNGACIKGKTKNLWLNLFYHI